jgi:GNAT superfamily N-acetyltransferase
MPKTEAFWRWKHVDNPFGKSPVLLAFDDGQLIGVRAFMRWEWRQGNRTYKAVRAVDTATHPQHQGRGIFKKLTLQLVEQCRNENLDFIFNTPNKHSKPGYLKMGWQKWGKLAIRVRPLLKGIGKKAGFEVSYSGLPLYPAGLEDWIDFPADRLITNRSVDYFIWRYRSNPNVNYLTLGDKESGYLVFFRLKPYALGLELRVCDVVMNRAVDGKAMQHQFLQAVQQSGASLLTFSPSVLPVTSLSLPLGPVITLKTLNPEKSLPFDCWSPTLGDMEVF